MGIINYLGQVPDHDDLVAVAAQAHIGLALIPRNADELNMRHMTGASNKPFDYMAAGLALLVGQPDRLGNRTVIERMVAQCDAVAGLDALRRLGGPGLVIGNRRKGQRSCREPATDEGERSTSR